MWYRGVDDTSVLIDDGSNRIEKYAPVVLEEDTGAKRNNTRPIFCGPLLQLWKGGARLHDALHATCPGLLPCVHKV